MGRSGTAGSTGTGRRSRSVNASSLTPSVRSRSSRATASATVGTVPAGIHQHTRYGLVHLLEPLAAAAQDRRVSAAVDEVGELFGRLPHRQVDDHQRVVVGPDVARRLAAVVGEPPHETRRRLGDGVDPIEVGDELGGVGVVEGLVETGDVELGEVPLRRAHERHAKRRPRPSPRPFRRAGRRGRGADRRGAWRPVPGSPRRPTRRHPRRAAGRRSCARRRPAHRR